MPKSSIRSKAEEPNPENETGIKMICTKLLKLKELFHDLKIFNRKDGQTIKIKSIHSPIAQKQFLAVHLPIKF